MLIAGVIDKDYRGNVGVIMFNFSKTDYEGTQVLLFITAIIC